MIEKGKITVFHFGDILQAKFIYKPIWGHLEQDLTKHVI